MFGTTRLHHGAASAGLRRRFIGTVAALALGVTALTGCAAGQISQSVDVVPNHDGAIGAVGPIGVNNALLGTSADGPGPVAFTAGTAIPLTLWVTNNALEADTLTSISTSAGDVTLSGTATVPAQGALQIGGDSAVSASIAKATADVKYGFPVSVDFYFKNAGKLSLQVPVTIPTERAAGRASTDIYPPEETNIWHDPISDNG
ncbi:MAG: hypothetical protein ABI382_02440 [Nakamurella sp.]